MGDEYSFLQEKIKDEAGSPKTLRKKIIRMIILGIIFGIVASFTFFVCKPWVEELLGKDKNVITIPEDEELEEEQEAEELSETAQQEAEEQHQLKVLKQLQTTAKGVSNSVVTVSGQKSLDKNSNVSRTTGIIIADNGSEILILSRNFPGGKNVKVTFQDENVVAAAIKMKDTNLGIAISAVEKSQIPLETWENTAIVNLGNSLRVQAGDPAILIGKTESAVSMVTYGFVISVKEEKAIADGYIGLLRADMTGSDVFSGMLFNADGELIGLIDETADDSKMLVTAYSISDIKNELEHLSNERGVPYIGVWGVDLPDELKEEGLEAGVWVEEVDADSPAMKAGIQCGDIITSMKETAIYNRKDYRNILLKQEVKSEIVMKGFRKGADDKYVEMEFKVQVGQK